MAWTADDARAAAHEARTLILVHHDHGAVGDAVDLLAAEGSAGNVFAQKLLAPLQPDEQAQLSCMGHVVPPALLKRAGLLGVLVARACVDCPYSVPSHSDRGTKCYKCLLALETLAQYARAHVLAPAIALATRAAASDNGGAARQVLVALFRSPRFPLDCLHQPVAPHGRSLITALLDCPPALAEFLRQDPGGATARLRDAHGKRHALCALLERDGERSGELQALLRLLCTDAAVRARVLVAAPAAVRSLVDSLGSSARKQTPIHHVVPDIVPFLYYLAAEGESPMAAAAFSDGTLAIAVRRAARGELPGLPPLLHAASPSFLRWVVVARPRALEDPTFLNVPNIFGQTVPRAALAALEGDVEAAKVSMEPWFAFFRALVDRDLLDAKERRELAHAAAQHLVTVSSARGAHETDVVREWQALNPLLLDHTAEALRRAFGSCWKAAATKESARARRERKKRGFWIGALLAAQALDDVQEHDAAKDLRRTWARAARNNARAVVDAACLVKKRLVLLYPLLRALVEIPAGSEAAETRVVKVAFDVAGEYGWPALAPLVPPLRAVRAVVGTNRTGILRDLLNDPTAQFPPPFGPPNVRHSSMSQGPVALARTQLTTFAVVREVSVAVFASGHATGAERLFHAVAAWTEARRTEKQSIPPASPQTSSEDSPSDGAAVDPRTVADAWAAWAAPIASTLTGSERRLAAWDKALEEACKAWCVQEPPTTDVCPCCLEKEQKGRPLASVSQQCTHRVCLHCYPRLRERICPCCRCPIHHAWGRVPES